MSNKKKSSYFNVTYIPTTDELLEFKKLIKHFESHYGQDLYKLYKGMLLNAFNLYIENNKPNINGFPDKYLEIVDSIITTKLLERFSELKKFESNKDVIKAYNNFLYYASKKENDIAIKHLPKALKYNCSIIAEEFVIEMILILRTKIIYSNDKVSEKDRMLLEDICKAIIPHETSGRKPIINLSGYELLDMLNDWQQLENILGKNYRKPDKSKKIKSYFKQKKNFNVEKLKIIDGSIKDIVLNVHMQFINKKRDKKVKFDAFKDAFKRVYENLNDLLTVIILQDKRSDPIIKK